MRFSWATKINLTCREEQFHRHQLHFMMYKQRRKCATYWEDDMTCVSMTVVAGAVAIILCYQRGPELANYLWNLVKTSLTSYHHLGNLTKFMEQISIRNTLQAQLHEALRKAWCFPKTPWAWQNSLCNYFGMVILCYIFICNPFFKGGYICWLIYDPPTFGK